MTFNSILVCFAKSNCLGHAFLYIRGKSYYKLNKVRFVRPCSPLWFWIDGWRSIWPSPEPSPVEEEEEEEEEEEGGKRDSRSSSLAYIPVPDHLLQQQ